MILNSVSLVNLNFLPCRICSRRFLFVKYTRRCASNGRMAVDAPKIGHTDGLRKNELGIQMVSSAIRQRVFGDSSDGVPNIAKPPPQTFSSWNGSRSQEDSYNMGHKTYLTPSRTNLCAVKEHLTKHGFWERKADKPAFEMRYAPQIFVEIPPFSGKNVDEHFTNIGRQFSDPYRKDLEHLATASLPPVPSQWAMKPGWTMYTIDPGSGETICESVSYPTDDILVFDVEVAMQHGNFPTMATAVSPKAWYSWCSEKLFSTESSTQTNEQVKIEDLIPLGPGDKERTIVGHNVSFDRSFIREQYALRSDKIRFMDTMSLHVCISGLTGYQRALSYSYQSAKNRGINEGVINDVFKMKKQPNPVNWEDFGSANSLVDVYDFYCKTDCDYLKLKKEARDTFVKGSLEDIRGDFQNLMSYCALDVKSTSSIFMKQWPQFVERFPHPVTLSGMLEMSIMYLPCNTKTWNKYLLESRTVYDLNVQKIKKSLTEFANETCSYLRNDKFKMDPWLWDLDWTVQDLRYRKSAKEASPPKALPVAKQSKKKKISKTTDENSEPLFSPFVEHVLNTKKSLNKKQPHMPGYPQWYRDFSLPYGSNAAAESDKNWEPGPYLISTQMRTVPKLLRIMFDGYALHHDLTHGWGYVVPKVLGRVNDMDSDDSETRFPYDEYIKIVKPIDFNDVEELDESFADNEVILHRTSNDDCEKDQKSTKADDVRRDSLDENNYCPDAKVFGCRFYKLPHKDGPENRVGNPLGKDFLRFVEEGRLSAYKSDIAHELLSVTKALSYWKMNSKRITSQILVEVNTSTHEAAILPRVICAGTVTRRAVERTWLTASNAYSDRVGSELKAMVSTPPGYRFVGADVDSQELWIASLLGDSHFAKIHGCTGIGWMTLQGTKAEGTDMHSKTASLVNIDRNQAKVLNYGRIYGAGKAFAARFLKQSDPSLSEISAKKKANEIYKQTKGVKSQGQWKGGSESHMFNKLEEVAHSSHPETPVLRGRISRALEAESVREDFVTSLINWVVQSSAVDYLHLMLVSMKWIFEHYKIEGRFAISIHDELRYVVREEDAYRVAVALQVSNLLTRSIFCYKLGIADLPQSVAFFSSVDIDTVLRKEVDMDCVTPSNPKGLRLGYGVEPGESLDIYKLIEVLKNQEALGKMLHEEK